MSCMSCKKKKKKIHHPETLKINVKTNAYINMTNMTFMTAFYVNLFKIFSPVRTEAELEKLTENKSL